MDYFSVLVLIIVTFVFVLDRSVKEIENIQKDNIIEDLLNKTQYVNNNMDVIQMESKDITYSNLTNVVKTCLNEYLLIQNKQVQLNENDKNTLIANYISSNMKPCGFNLLYQYKNKKGSFKGIYIDIINYLNIFNKEELSTYGIIICKKEDLLKGEDFFQNILVCYTPSKLTHVVFPEENIKADTLKNIYINRIGKAKLSIIVKILLLIISGSIITTNLIYSILNANNIYALIISSVIYYCYSYIIRYIYKPIGKKRMLSTYIFPIYFACYIFITVNAAISRVIKKVHAS